MITEDKYSELLNKLDNYISLGTKEVSPTTVSGVGLASPDKFLLSSETDVDKLTEQEALLSHALLHQFYARGGVNNLNKTEIEKLHKKITERITGHQTFDALDKI